MIRIMFLLSGGAMMFASLVSFAGPRRVWGVESDSGRVGPPYQQIVKSMEDLSKKYPDLATHVVYGKTAKGMPLQLVRLARANFSNPSNPTAPRKAVLIAGTIHGDEFLGVEDKLPYIFLDESAKLPGITQYLKEGGVIYMAPVLNPEGYAARDRYNSKGIDLNRDFPIMFQHHEGFTQPETGFLGKYLHEDMQKNNLKLIMTLDYHCCIGALLHPWSFDDAPALPEKDLKRHQFVGNILRKFFGMEFPVGTTPDLLGYSAMGTSKDYYYERYHSTSFTYEGVYQDEYKNLYKHVQFWDEIFSTMVTQWPEGRRSRPVVRR